MLAKCSQRWYKYGECFPLWDKYAYVPAEKQLKSLNSRIYASARLFPKARSVILSGAAPGRAALVSPAARRDISVFWHLAGV